ncbi:hypothetical protein B0T09DRAFT_263863 [Sordaria sp. MPI-SDFR-AT-0083]|nr:hypothetical protein B0T09DRAFT_263863 [Sordaria sp. MPI-SDFR-AT-0083]
MEIEPPATPPSPSKRKSPSFNTTDRPRHRNHKRQRTVEREDPAFKPSHHSLSQLDTSSEKFVESHHKGQESEGKTTVSEPMDIESQDGANNHVQLSEDLARALDRNIRVPISAPLEPDVSESETTVSEPMDIESQNTAGNRLQLAHDLQYALNRSTRRPIFASSLEPGLSKSDIDDEIFDSDFELDSDDEDFNSVTKEPSRSNRVISRYEGEFYAAMCDIEYYNSLPEPELRRQAIRWMEENSRNDPKGTVVYPPPWYIGTRFHPPRPKIWIKNFFSGRVRPRQLVNDRLAAMTVSQREKWARDHGMGGYDDEDADMDTE